MKALSLLSLLFLVSSSALFSKDNSSLDKYISDNKKEQFGYDYQKNEAESSKLRDSWIAPIHLNYSYSKSNPYEVDQLNENAAIKIDQPIFQSGGIYYAIKFANASKMYSDYSIDVAKRKLIKDAISILMQIKQVDMKIVKQKLQIENSEINLKLKKDQYLNGQLDSGFLDKAVIERNFIIQTLYDFQTSKEKLISTFNTISDLDYKIAKIPYLEFIKQEEFLKHNIIMKMAKSKIKKDMYNKDITVAKYLPQVSVTAGYNWSKTDSRFNNFGDPVKKYHDYGFKVYMPININTFRDIESSRVDYLKSKVNIEDKQRELTALFEQVMQNMDNLDKKKTLSLENKDIYTKLLNDTKNLFSAGYKTEYDVQTLENSVVISELNSKIYEMDRQLELLNLYEMYINEI
ncbi:MAG: TolC family protein [Sulfurimonas sp.]|nr:TolC family protein [Sulfurimonas sp.]